MFATSVSFTSSNSSTDTRLELVPRKRATRSLRRSDSNSTHSVEDSDDIVNHSKRLYSLSARHPNVIFSCRQTFDKKMRNLHAATIEKLHIISDFDRTLTRGLQRGSKSPGWSTHSVLEHSSELSDRFKSASLRLLEKYYPIEVSHELTAEEKSPIMMEWYSHSQEALLEEKLTKKRLLAAIEECHGMIELRPGTEELLKQLEGSGIPVLVFSAGLATIIDMLFRTSFNQESIVESEFFHIIGNWLKFDQNNKHIGFSKPLVHPFNKNEALLHSKAKAERKGPKFGQNYFNNVEKRRNAILLGDGLGDVHMADGVKHDTLLKVGFLNKNVDKLLEEYKKVYDVIIIDDGSFEFVSEEILGPLLRESAFEVLSPDDELELF